MQEAVLVSETEVMVHRVNYRVQQDRLKER